MASAKSTTRWRKAARRWMVKLLTAVVISTVASTIGYVIAHVLGPAIVVVLQHHVMA